MAYVHNIDPFALELNWNIFGFHLDGIRWYGLAYLAAFFTGYLTIYFLAKKKLILIPLEKAGDFTTYIALGVLIGGRVGYALFYSPELITEFSSNAPFWGVLQVHKGGMASHGGILGVMFASWLFSRKYKIPVLQLIDLTVIAGSLGFFFGRIANFINGELYGRECPPGTQFGMKFPQEVYRYLRDATSTVHDVQAPALEKLKAFGSMVGQWNPRIAAPEWSNWIDKLAMPGFSQTDSRVYEFFEWMILASQQGNQQAILAMEPLLSLRYPSQLYQAVLEGLIVFVILVLIWLRPRKSGVIASWFGILYLIMRTIGEQFRMPDAHIGFEALGLTRGQWLSLAMLIAAFLMLWYSLKKEGPKYGGFLEKAAPAPSKPKKTK